MTTMMMTNLSCIPALVRTIPGPLKVFFLLLLTFLSWCFALGAIESPPIPTKEVLPFS